MSELEEYDATTAHIEGILEGTITIFVQSAIIGCMIAYDTTRTLFLNTFLNNPKHPQPSDSPPTKKLWRARI